MDIVTQPITTLKGVGPKLAEKLARLGLRSVTDLLFHLPFRYQDRTRLTPLGALVPGNEALIDARVELSDVVYRGRRNLLVRVADSTGALMLRFFHFSAAQQAGFARGRRVRAFGEVRMGATGPEMIHPEYEWLADDAAVAPEATLTPFYPTTEGVHAMSIRRLVRDALARELPSIEELLPESLLADLGLPTLSEALRVVHEPSPRDAAALLAGRHPAQQRLAFEELLAFHLSLRQLRDRAQRLPAPVLDAPGKLVSKFFQSLPFKPTRAQLRVIDEIAADLRAPHPMQRLVQGDVGSGKTLVAVAACLQAIEAGRQAAVMAPTELLAEQHWKNFHHWLVPLGIDVAWLSGKLNAPTRRAMLSAIREGRAPVAVGTHALFQDEVEFHRLALVVIDEQHRFGVQQRLSLRDKGASGEGVPHQLILTATPIPRTLAQTLHADLDISVIDELPPGRTPVETVALPDTRRADVVARVREACLGGRQAYWVCPLIETSELLEAEAATATAATLAEALPELRIALVHGRLKPAEKEKVMAAFKAGETQLLVATTVIEVGVDVPNASLMIIENAERLGLSQLHQLRGRVGRGSEKSSCVLMYHPPLGETARERIDCLRKTTDGFEIARRDLELRGPGEVLGTRQTGESQFHIADLVRDQALLPRIDAAARELRAHWPDRIEPIIQRWLRGRERFGEV